MTLRTLVLVLMLAAPVFAQAPAKTLSQQQIEQATLLKASADQNARAKDEAIAQITAAARRLAQLETEERQIRQRADVLGKALVVALGGGPTDALDWSTLALKPKTAAKAAKE